ncbi:MAG TPA: hypothetical protein VF691_02520 [Cytophagaceae bacterium]|jgi:ABC-type lipoprotein export system ATPase subunit
MFDNLSYKKRNIYLAGASVVFFFLVYTFSYSKTIHLFKQNNDIRANIERGQFAAQNIQSLEKKYALMDNMLKNYSNEGGSSQVLAIAAELCKKHSIVLKEFPAAVKTEEENFETETNIVNAEGNYKNLLSFLHDMEAMGNTGRICSASFKSYIDNKKKTRVLGLTIFIQNIKPLVK